MGDTSIFNYFARVVTDKDRVRSLRAIQVAAAIGADCGEGY
jgi:hypothetical protein